MTITHKKKLIEKFEPLFEEELLKMFPIKSQAGIKINKGKYKFELEKIANSLDHIKIENNPIIMDVGCGFGVNLIMSKLLWNVEAIGVDRFDEFDDIHNREVGTRNQVIRRMTNVGILVKELNFVTEPFDDEYLGCDVITNFDVIEHFTFSPMPFLNKMYKLLNNNGTLIIGTPNQVHLKNRILCACGKNTWEDFNYYISSNIFYGHVREFTPIEFRWICNSLSSKAIFYYSTYPILNRAEATKYKIIKIFFMLLNYMFEKFPTINYYQLATIKK